MKKILSGAILILVAGVLVLQIDDDLDPEVLAFVDKAETMDSDAYYYLMGMSASVAEDPARVGREIFKSVRKRQEASGTGRRDVKAYDYPPEKRLRLPKGDLLCMSWKTGCLAGLFRNSEYFENKSVAARTLLSRYAIFLDFNEYTTVTKPAYDEATPEYGYLMAANRLYVLESIGVVRDFGTQKALSMLSGNIKRLRRQLALQDTWFGKMVLLSQISENIDVAYVLSKKAKPEDLFKIPQLSLQEKNVEVLMAREFAMVFDLYKGLGRDPEAFGMGEDTPSWIVKMLYKPNVVINANFPMYVRMVEYSKLSHQEFVTRIKGNVPISIESRSVRNLLGDILLDVRWPNFHTYLAQFYDLDAKLALYNALVGYGSIETHLSKAINPYYTDDNSASLSTDGSWVCFDGPLPDIRKFRCLPENIVNVSWQVDDRAPGDEAVYPDDDLQAEMIDGKWVFTRTEWRSLLSD